MDLVGNFLICSLKFIEINKVTRCVLTPANRVIRLFSPHITPDR